MPKDQRTMLRGREFDPMDDTGQVRTPTLRAAIIGPQSDEWTEFLQHISHDAYHLAAYVELMAEYMNGLPRAFISEEGDKRFFLPLIIRPIDHLEGVAAGTSDVTCPYGYPGPIVSTGSSEVVHDFIDRSIGRMLSLFGNAGLVSGFFRLHPLMPLPYDVLRKYGVLVHHGDTIAIDLRLTEEELSRQTRSNHRRDIRHAIAAGYVVRIDPTWNALDEFVDIYHSTMERLNAEHFYMFPREHFVELQDALGKALHLCVVEREGNVVAAGLFSEVDGLVEYLFSGTRAEHLRASPLKSMLHFITKWARLRGNHTLHLGGGVNAASDELFRFKLGFSPTRLPFFTWRIVTNEGDYRSLVQTWAISHGVAMTDADPSGFFPAYRRNSATQKDPRTDP